MFIRYNANTKTELTIIQKDELLEITVIQADQKILDEIVEVDELVCRLTEKACT